MEYHVKILMKVINLEFKSVNLQYNLTIDKLILYEALHM